MKVSSKPERNLRIINPGKKSLSQRVKNHVSKTLRTGTSSIKKPQSKELKKP